MPDPTSWRPSEARTGAFESHGANQNILMVSAAFSRGKGVISRKRAATIVLSPEADFPSFCTRLAPVDRSPLETPGYAMAPFEQFWFHFNLLSCCGIIPKFWSNALIYAHNGQDNVQSANGSRSLTRVQNTCLVCMGVGQGSSGLWCASPGVPTRSTVVRNKPARQ